MARSARSHHPDDFALDIAHDELDLFRWFLLVYLLGKPIQSPVAMQTWRLLVEHQLDTPWALRWSADASCDYWMKANTRATMRKQRRRCGYAHSS